MTASWAVTIMGAPRTKKTHNVLARAGRRHRGRHIVLPSKAWQRWVRTAKVERGLGWAALLPIAVPVNARALFYRDAERGDAVGYYQGLADLLQERDLVVDDRLILSWDGSRLLKDRANPRVELILQEVTPLELELLPQLYGAQN